MPTKCGRGREWKLVAISATFALALTACGARTGLLSDDPEDTGPRPDAEVAPDADVDADPDVDVDADIEADADEDVETGCIPVDDLCLAGEQCNDGDDDDCDGFVDEGCACTPGDVQACFVGPPGRRGIGACDDGMQTCEMSGAWGPCTGGIWPRDDVCNGLDNQCNGCSALEDCEIDCPGPDDPRVVAGSPFEDYELNGRDFYPGLVSSWRWEVEGGPCDEIAPRFESFELRSPRSEQATLYPLLSGDYRVTLTVVTEAGTRLSCDWLVHVRGPGLRVEMCYPESEFEDLDLFLKQPGFETDWYLDTINAFTPSVDQCGWHNCEAMIRGSDPVTGAPLERADWGYANSDISECEGGPQGDQWRSLGFCANPRLDIDNNLSEGTGLPENINVDTPRDGETFRVMVQSFTGGSTQPLVNIYCNGRRIATYGAPPDIVPDFSGPSGHDRIGAMWRVVDVTTHVDAAGELTCEVDGLHPPGSESGYNVTVGDISF